MTNYQLLNDQEITECKFPKLGNWRNLPLRPSLTCMFYSGRNVVTQKQGKWLQQVACEVGLLQLLSFWDPVCLLSSPLSPPFSSCFTKCFPSSHQLPYPSSTNSQQLTPFHSISLPAEFPPHSKAYSWTNNPKLIALLLKCTKNPSSTTSYPHSGPDSNLPLGSHFNIVPKAWPLTHFVTTNFIVMTLKHNLADSDWKLLNNPP